MFCAAWLCHRRDAGQKHCKAEEDFQHKAVEWLKKKEYLYDIGSTGHYYGPAGWKMAAKMKRLGALNGVPDVQIFEPNPDTGKCLFVELKVGANTVSEDQASWLARAKKRGHATAVIYSFDEFVRAVDEHLTPSGPAATSGDPIVVEE